MVLGPSVSEEAEIVQQTPRDRYRLLGIRALVVSVQMFSQVTGSLPGWQGPGRLPSRLLRGVYCAGSAIMETQRPCGARNTSHERATVAPAALCEHRKYRECRERRRRQRRFPGTECSRRRGPRRNLPRCREGRRRIPWPDRWGPRCARRDRTGRATRRTPGSASR